MGSFDPDRGWRYCITKEIGESSLDWGTSTDVLDEGQTEPKLPRSRDEYRAVGPGQETEREDGTSYPCPRRDKGGTKEGQRSESMLGPIA